MKAGHELDILVANKVFGWEYDEFLAMFYTKDETVCIPRHSNFRPSTNIADAWKVVEKIHATDNTWLHLAFDESESFWLARFSDRLNFIQKETAPLAICLAALKALGQEV